MSLGQLKVMSAIENCRTAALGGHVARCEDCAHEVIAYNSCRNRHCPRCQGAAARAWLAEREAELLPVPYYHLVFTLPAAIADIAYHNKATVYDLLFKASSETLITTAADPKHLGARVGVISVLHTWGSALTHHPHVHMIAPGAASRWTVCAGSPAGPASFCTCAFSRGCSAVSSSKNSWPPSTPASCSSLEPSRSRGARRIHGVSRAFPQGQMGRLFQATVRRTRSRAGLSGALHPSRRHRQQPADRAPRRRRHVQMERLSDQRSRSPKDDDASCLRVHPPLSHSRPAERLPSHSPLRPVGQRRSRANIAQVRQLLTPAAQSNPNEAADDPGEADPPNPYPCPCCGGRMIVIETFGRAGPSPSRMRIDTS